MRKIITGAFVSLDGIMQAPGGPDEDPIGDFKYGGWVAPYFDQAGEEAVGEMFAKPFDLLLGRKTYDIFAAHWPYVDADDPIGPLFDRITKYVATRNPSLKLDWQNSQTLGPDVVAAVKKLKDEEGPDLLTQGSTDFLQTLFRHQPGRRDEHSRCFRSAGQGQEAVQRRRLSRRLETRQLEGLRVRRHNQQIRPRRRHRDRLVRIRRADRGGVGATQEPDLNRHGCIPSRHQRPSHRTIS